MKYAWLNFVLQLTNRIYLRKQKVVTQEGFRAAGTVFYLVFLEMVLAIVSLPLYINLKPANITAYLEEKGEYGQITFDYALRRVLTLTGVGIFLVIWLIKLLLILLVPTVFGPLQLYSVTDLEPPDILTVSPDLIRAETDIQTATVSSSLRVPLLTEVQKIKGKNYTFYGEGKPNTTIVLLLSDKQTALYTDQVNENGEWKIEHEQKDFVLNEGNHSVLAFTFDRETKTRSQFSDEQYFKVKTTLLDQAVRQVDVLANWSIIIILLIGMFLVLLTI